MKHRSDTTGYYENGERHQCHPMRECLHRNKLFRCSLSLLPLIYALREQQACTQHLVLSSPIQMLSRRSIDHRTNAQHKIQTLTSLLTLSLISFVCFQENTRKVINMSVYKTCTYLFVLILVWEVCMGSSAIVQT